MAYRLEKFVEGKWWMWGTYNANSIPQLCYAVALLAESGFKMGEDMRVVVTNE